MAQDIERAHRRLAILRYLEKAPGYSSNSAIIADVVNGVGVRSTRDQVEGEIAWLAAQGLATREEIGGLVIATATGPGCEVARGEAEYPGVRRPSAR